MGKKKNKSYPKQARSRASGGLDSLASLAASGELKLAASTGKTAEQIEKEMEQEKEAERLAKEQEEKARKEALMLERAKREAEKLKLAEKLKTSYKPEQRDILDEKELKNKISYDNNVKFINPYNFVSLTFMADRKPIQHGVYTGYIDCSLVAKTPLIIPGDCVDPKADHKKYETLSVNGNPIISGSEIRGVVRSMYETLSSSCLSTTDDLMITSRYDGYLKNAGLLFKDKLLRGKIIKFQVYKPKPWISIKKRYKPDELEKKDSTVYLDEKRILHLHGEDKKTGDIVYLNLNSEYIYENDYGTFIKSKEGISFEYMKGFTKGYLLLGEGEDKKGQYIKIIIEDNSYVVESNQGENLRKQYFQLMKEYRDEKNVAAKSKNVTYNAHSNSNITEESEVIPVWYQEVQGALYVSPSQRGRLVYARTMKQLLKDFYPCDDKEKVCPACSLFGTINDKTKISVPSKIRISDATTNMRNCVSKDYKTLAPLSSPKYSNAEFYALVKGKAIEDHNMLNYDYYKNSYNDRYGNIQTKNLGIDNKDITIRGRKFFWHFKPDQFIVPGNKRIEPNQLNTSNKTINTNTEFTFKVYFDEITEEQLKQLIITLNLEGNDNSLCYKIGHAKSLGYGSCKIKVNDVKYRNIDRTNGFSYSVDTFADRYESFEEAFGNNVKLYYEVRTICDYDYLTGKGKIIGYPIGDGEEQENYKWFMNNRVGASEGTNKLNKINQTLPFVSKEYDQIVMKGYKNND